MAILQMRRAKEVAPAHALGLAEDYLDAWQRKDLRAIAKLIHPEIHLKSPMTELTGREDFLAMCERIFPVLIAVRVRTKFATENQAMLAYDFVLREPVGVTRTANLITIEDNLIRSIELFFDGRPFERFFFQGHAVDVQESRPIEAKQVMALNN